MIVSEGYEEKRLRLIGDYAVGQSVLDLGYAQQPNPHLMGLAPVGLDLERPTEPSGYDEELVGNVMDVPTILAGREFDTVVCGELIEHVENPYELLRGIRTVLPDSGRLLLTTPNPLSIPVVFAELTRMTRWFYTRDHLYYFLPRWVNRLLEHTGFRCVDMVSIGLWTPWRALPGPVALSYQVLYVAERVEPVQSIAEAS